MMYRPWRAAAALVLTVAAAAGTSSPLTGVAAHSSVIEPLDRTWSNSCRIGGINGAGKWCPGPCPRDPERKNYQVRTYRRGQSMKLIYYRNNHSGMKRGCSAS